MLRVGKHLFIDNTSVLINEKCYYMGRKICYMVTERGRNVQ